VQSEVIVRLDPEQIEVIDDTMAAVLRSKTGVKRLKIASAMFESAIRRRALSGT
jgi:hypothetical protein